MDAYRYLNNYPDYSPQNASLYLKDGYFSTDLLLAIQSTESKFSKKLDKVVSAFQPDSDYSVYTGYGGIAYFLFLKSLITNNPDLKDRALSIIDNAIANLKNKRISFLNGDAGPLALGAVLRRDKPKEADKLIDRLVHLNFESSSHPDEVLYGRAGYLYSLLFVDKYYAPVIPLAVYRKVIMNILLSGRKLARETKAQTPIHYMWHDKVYLGAAHGMAGILYMLLCAHEMLEPEEKDLMIKPTLDYLSKQKFDSGNYLSSRGSNRDRLVQWCHGAPGFVHLFLQAYKVYKDQNYLNLALSAGDVVWERGLLEKGYSICHGVSGNAYTFLALYKATKDPKHLYRAACFADWCTNHPRNEGMKPDRPYSLFEGIAGVAYFLINLQDPLNSTFPAYEI